MIPVLEIGGTHVTAALVSPRTAAVATRVRRPLDAQARAGDILGAVLRCARRLPAAPAGARWGVAVPGPFDYAKGVALFADVGKFDALYGVDVRAALLDGLPGNPSDVAFRNDAHAFLAGEWTAGAARGHTRAVGITLGTGVGSAFLADGALRTTGPGVPPEGRMDLTRTGGRPLEEVVSRRAILSRYGAAAGAAVDVREIAERARAGEERARRVLDAAFGALGAELGPRLAAFRATVLVVGGSMAESWDLVAPPLAAALAAGGWHPAVEGAVSPTDAVPPRGEHGGDVPGASHPDSRPRAVSPARHAPSAGGPPLRGESDAARETSRTPSGSRPGDPPGPAGPQVARLLVRALLGEDAGLIGAAAAAGGAG
ncbi:ROK family protein [Streptomyces sp. WMMC500]|uniref:ROK family protein n=1 Tax=Streptomyces sp. WMMC500 TaxID=3015154 RepID=UPI00248A9C7C|nr:ROK family protein [Streptomyces sp. WMMC500]WBB60600.1 ROK family protein [Streptomyces sp. WMMC500]